MDYEITCVCKDSRGDIVGVGCQGPHYFKRTTVADMINRGYTFHTKDSTGKTASVFVYDQTRKFIKTAADGVWTDNLDGLPLCRDCHLCQ